MTAGKSVPANVTGRQMSAGKAHAGKSPAGIRVFTGIGIGIGYIMSEELVLTGIGIV